MTQWIDHLRSTTDYVVPDDINRILDLAPRVKVISKNLNNTDLVNRIINAPKPTVQAIEDDAVSPIRSSHHFHSLILMLNRFRSVPTIFSSTKKANRPSSLSPSSKMSP